MKKKIRFVQIVTKITFYVDMNVKIDAIKYPDPRKLDRMP